MNPFKLFFVIGASIIALCGTSARASLEISEFMASNKTVLQDADGDFSDWIEIKSEWLGTNG